MANLSSAFGTATFKGDEETIRALTTLVKECLDGVDYYTSLIDDFDSRDYSKEEGWSTDFQGCGRWAYEANIESFMRWIKSGVDEKPKLDDLWQQIVKADWSILFEYIDEEGGCDYLAEAQIVIEHKAGENDITILDVFSSFYDCTPENLVALGVCDDIPEAKEYIGLDVEDEDYDEDDNGRKTSS